MPQNPEEELALFLATLSSGGAQAVIVKIANNLAESGYPVSLLVGNSNGPLRRLVSDKVNIVDFDCLRVSRSVPKLISYLRKKKFKTLLTTQLHSNIICTVAGVLSGGNTKIIIRESTTPSKAFELSQNKVERAFYRIAKFIFPFAHHAVAVSDAVKEDMVNFYGLKPSKISRIYNPIIDEKLYEKAEEKLEHHWLDLGIPILATVSRVAPTKDIETMIRAFAAVRSSGYEAKFLIIGECVEHKEYYEKQLKIAQDLGVANDIDFLGFQSNPYKWLARADIYLSASLLEGLPGSIIQAFALGCKMVVTNCKSGPKEVLDNGKYGLLIPEHDHQAMAEAIIKQINGEHSFSVEEKAAHLKKFAKESNMEAYCSFLVNSYKSNIVQQL